MTTPPGDGDEARDRSGSEQPPGGPGRPPYGTPGTDGPSYGRPGPPPSGAPAGYGPPWPGPGFAGQPSGQAPPYGQPSGQAPPYGGPFGAPGPYGGPYAAPSPYAPPYGEAPFGPPAAPPRKRRTGLVVGLVGALVAAVAVAVVLSLTLGSTVLDRSATQRDVATQFQRVEGESIRVSCPQQMTVRRGATYECTGATQRESAIPITIRITDERTSAYTWEAKR